MQKLTRSVNQNFVPDKLGMPRRLGVVADHLAIDPMDLCKLKY